MLWVLVFRPRVSLLLSELLFPRLFRVLAVAHHRAVAAPVVVAVAGVVVRVENGIKKAAPEEISGAFVSCGVF